MLCVSENFAKLLKIMRNYTAEYGMCKFLLVLNCNVVSTLYHSRNTNHLIMACPSNFGQGSFDVIETGTIRYTISTAADTSSLCQFLQDFFKFYNLITLVTADVLVYFWHKYSAEKWIYLQKCK